jgi:hypothetical protein
VLDLDKLFSRCTVLCFSLVRTAAKAFIFRGENSGRLERASPIFFSTQTEIRPRACDLASPAHHFSVALPRIFYRSILVRLQTQLAFCYHRQHFGQASNSVGFLLPPPSTLVLSVCFSLQLDLSVVSFSWSSAP